MPSNQLVLVRRFPPIEPVVHADQNSGCFCVGVEETTSHTDSGAEHIMIVRAEVHVVAFQKRRPVRREHPFNATTCCPTCSGPITHIAEVNASKGYVCFGIGPGYAALTVD